MGGSRVLRRCLVWGVKALGYPPGRVLWKRKRRLLPIVTPFFRQIIDQLWPHLNPNAGVLPMIGRGTPMRFEAIAYAPTNAQGCANPPIENGPGTTIAQRTNHECPMFCRSSQNYKGPGYLQRLIDESSENREGLEHSY
ncbi:hypothetical protein HOY80DRAFT_941423, partial [Tuber brumale]